MGHVGPQLILTALGTLLIFTRIHLLLYDLSAILNHMSDAEKTEWTAEVVEEAEDALRLALDLWDSLGVCGGVVDDEIMAEIEEAEKRVREMGLDPDDYDAISWG